MFLLLQVTSSRTNVLKKRLQRLEYTEAVYRPGKFHYNISTLG